MNNSFKKILKTTMNSHFNVLTPLLLTSLLSPHLFLHLGSPLEQV